MPIYSKKTLFALSAIVYVTTCSASVTYTDLESTGSTYYSIPPAEIGNDADNVVPQIDSYGGPGSSGIILLNGKTIKRGELNADGGSYTLKADELNLKKGDVLGATLYNATPGASFVLGYSSTPLSVGQIPEGSIEKCTAHVPTSIDLGIIAPGDVTTSSFDVKVSGGTVLWDVEHNSNVVSLTGNAGTQVNLSPFPVDSAGNISWVSGTDKTFSINVSAPAGTQAGAATISGPLVLNCE